MKPRLSHLLWTIALTLLWTHQTLGKQADEAQAKIPETIDAYLSDLEENNKFLGSIALVQNGQTILCEAYGFREMEEGREKVPSDKQTAYRIGSITKMFTSVLIAQLVEAEKLSLDDKLEKFFPDVKNADKITIDQLLRHRSGLKNLTSTAGYIVWCKSPQSRDAMMERIKKLPADFEPGEKTAYSNTNYLLLGYIIEKVTGSTYGDVLQEKITGPLGLKRTFFEPDEPIENEAKSFRMMKSWISTRETHQSVPHGAGAIVSTPEDLAKFIRALFDGKLVSKQSLEKITDVSSGLGQGMMQFPFDDKRAFGHGGAIDGFQANLAYFPNEDLVVAVCSNGIAHPFNDVLIGVLTRGFGLPVTPPAETIEVDVEMLRKYEGVYAAEGFPLKITIAIDDDGNLTGQATGQSAFPLSATSETKFHFDPASIKIEFLEGDESGEVNRFKFEQGPNKLTFEKEVK